MIRNYIIYSFLLLIMFIPLHAQRGHLLMMGGGSEQSGEGTWNQEAYCWAVSQSINKRVAIIAYGSASSWLPNYFMDECNAVQAKNFNISTSGTADDQATYDSLMTYDVIFLKGGDQYNYYSTYKGTYTEKAILDKYQDGGVICGTSAGLAVLGGVDFTAKNGSAYPDEVLGNINHPTIQLADDFLPMIPGLIFDSHFAERGRFGRLLAFLAHWYQETGEALLGIGVDDQTAFAIDTSLLATAYGSGSVSIYHATQDVFNPQEGKLLADGIRVDQLLDGWSMDLESLQITAGGEPSNPALSGEKTNQVILASGSDRAGDNQEMLEYLIQETGIPDDPVLILTRSDQSLAMEFKLILENIGTASAAIKSVSIGYQDDKELTDLIRDATKILFVNNYSADLTSFIGNGSAGRALEEKLNTPGVILAFAGGNSRLIGHIVVDNYLTENASYHANLEFNPGLDILKHSVIMPHTFYNSDFYENTATAVPYAMIGYALRYGIWLSADNFLIYRPTGSYAQFSSSGTMPVMILVNNGGKAGHAEQTVHGSTNESPRMIAGFTNMELYLVDQYNPLQAGDWLSSIRQPGHILNSRSPAVKYLSQQQRIIIESNVPVYLNLYGMDGRLLLKQYLENPLGGINIRNIEPGLYIAEVWDQGSRRQETSRIMILDD